MSPYYFYGDRRLVLNFINPCQYLVFVNSSKYKGDKTNKAGLSPALLKALFY
jgi:hypothetical protein